MTGAIVIEGARVVLSDRVETVSVRIEDSNGNVVRWVWSKPSVPHIVRPLRRVRKKFDPFTLPPALF